MARRQTKNIRVTKNEAYLINKKYLGDEPVFTEKLVDGLEYSKHLTWYNYMCTVQDAREYLTEYLNKTNRADEAKKLSSISDSWYPTTASWIARMRSRGAVLSESSNKFFEKSIKESLLRVKTQKTVIEESSDKVINVQQKIKDRSDEILSEIEGLIDDGMEFDLYEWLKRKEIPTVYVNYIIVKYQPWLDELLQAYEGTDEQLVEGYNHLTKKQLKERIIFFHKILQDAERYGSNEKKARAVRKPRKVSVEKKLKHFNFKKDDKEYKLTSINPEKIIGAQELWTFNTKYKTLTVFRAIDRGGLQINRSSITNYNEETSVSKRIGRKTEEYLKKVIDGGKIVLRKLMDEINTSASFTDRMNENTILLKIS